MNKTTAIKESHKCVRINCIQKESSAVCTAAMAATVTAAYRLRKWTFIYSLCITDHHHIFVGDLSSDLEVRQIKEAFMPFGEIS